MPTLKIKKSTFQKEMGQNLSQDKLDKLGMKFGVEYQGLDNGEYKFEISNNRSDLWSIQGLIQSFRLYEQKSKNTIIRALKPKITHQILVDKNISQVRPYVVGAILRGIKFTQQNYDSFIKYQQKLHLTICKNRQLSSMGTHNLDSIDGPFIYKVLKPEQINFIPLFRDKKMNGYELVKEFSNDKHLKKYLHLLDDKKGFPVILDKNQVICSLPPLINSEHSKMSLQSKNIFIQITGLQKQRMNTCLNNLIWSFSRYCQQPFTVQPIQIIYHQYKQITPNIKQRQMSFFKKDAQILIGQSLDDQMIIKLLMRMGLETKLTSKDQFLSKIPIWRSDILHKVDILEDLAIAFGYQFIKFKTNQSRTIGIPLSINKVTDLIRNELAFAGINQVLNFILTSNQMLKFVNENEDQFIKLKNPKSVQCEFVRKSLMYGLLKSLNANKTIRLPIKLFQVGDVIIDSQNSIGNQNQRKLGILITTQIKVNMKGYSIFGDIHGYLDYLMQKVKISQFLLVNSKNKLFLSNQQSEIFIKNNNIGIMGIIHPRINKLINWEHPIAYLQISLMKLIKYIK